MDAIIFSIHITIAQPKSNVINNDILPIPKIGMGGGVGGGRNSEEKQSQSKTTYTVVDILDRSTPVPFPHPGFCLLAKFWENLNINRVIK